MTLFRRFLAVIVALALGALAAVAGAEIIAIRTGDSPLAVPIDDWARRLADGSWSRWSANAWTIASAATLAVGLVLVAVQLIPHRTVTFDRSGNSDGRAVRFGRRGLEERLRDVAVDQESVLEASVRVRKRRITITASVPDSGDRPGALAAVRSAASEEIDRLRLSSRPRLQVGVERSGSRVL